MTVRRTLLPLLFALLRAPAASLSAQAVAGSGGIAVPMGALAEERGVGFRVQGSVFTPSGRVRADLAGVSFPAADEPGAEAYRSLSVAINLLPTLVRTGPMRLRALAGLSAHWVDVPGVSNPYGTVPGLQLGGVLERAAGGGTLTAEAGLHLIASDYGVGELEGAFFVPVLIGFRF